MRILVTLAVLMTLAVLPSMGDEVVYFTSGTRMVVQGHKVLDNMLHIDLGEESSMALPVAMVEKVTNGSKTVFDSAAYQGASSKDSGAAIGDRTAFASPDRGFTSYARNRSTRAGIGSRRGSQGSGAAAASRALDTLLNGNAENAPAPPDYSRPFAGHPSSAMRKVKVAGDMRAFGPNAAATSRNSRGEKSHTALTPGGDRILGGEPGNGSNSGRSLNGVEVIGMELNTAAQRRAITSGERMDESRYTSNTVVEGDN
jgi:hypothetical protein